VDELWHLAFGTQQGQVSSAHIIVAHRIKYNFVKRQIFCFVFRVKFVHSNGLMDDNNICASKLINDELNNVKNPRYVESIM
jgi:hypothetical protein